LAAYFSELLLRSLGLAIPFQAEYEGSIPFTRSNLFKRLENRDCERGREIRNESWLLFGRRRPSLARGVGLAGPFQLDRVIGLE
jgi:hypothetical protein